LPAGPETSLPSSFTSGSGANYSGTFTVLKATGGLAGLHLQGTFQGNASGNTYSYNYHFDPKS
jgi:hypothetical protein